MKVKLLRPDAILPTFATPGSAAIDLYSVEGKRLYSQCPRPITFSTGIAMAIPPGVAGLICSRSGLAAKQGVVVLNAPGVIDSDYRGEIKVVLMNFGEDSIDITPGMRIAQMMFVPVYQVIPTGPFPASFEVVDSLDETERGSGGFGSTGV